MNKDQLHELATILGDFQAGRTVGLPHYTGAIERISPQGYAARVLNSLLAMEPRTAYPLFLAVVFGDRSGLEEARAKVMEVVATHATGMAIRNNRHHAEVDYAVFP